MRNTIAVMNTKGGVGKSTLVLSVAETLSAQFGKNVLIIDSDAQASVSANAMRLAGSIASNASPISADSTIREPCTSIFVVMVLGLARHATRRARAFKQRMDGVLLA